MRFGTRLVQKLSQLHCRLAEIVVATIARCQVARRPAAEPENPAATEGEQSPVLHGNNLGAVTIYESDQ
jgi:hypothetical protein